MSIVSTQSVRCTLWFVCDARLTVCAYARLHSFVVTGTSILCIWDIQVSPLANVGRKRGLHLRNLLALTSVLRFEFPVSAVVEWSYGGFFKGKVNANRL